MRIDQSQLERAMSELGFTRDQSALLWSKLDSTPGVGPRFEPAHVGLCGRQSCARLATS
jgi:hypothetical protein